MIPELENVEKFNLITKDIKYSDNTILIIKIGEDWCGPCNSMDSYFENIKKTDDSVIFYKIIHSNESFSEIINQKKINKIPYVLFYKNNELIKETKFLSEVELVNIISELRK